MAALERPTTSTYETHENVKVDTLDHEDHTFCGIMFPVKAKNDLPVTRLVIHSVSVRGALGPLTVWVTNEDVAQEENFSVMSLQRIRNDSSHWTKIYEKNHRASRRNYVKLDFSDQPIILQPGQRKVIYVHSAAHHDQAIVYDNSSSLRSTRYEDAFLSIHSGAAHLSPTPFDGDNSWGWGAPWREYREFVGQIDFGAIYQLWGPELHSQFGNRFQEVTHTLLACQRRSESPVALLPDECIMYILNMCRWDWFGDSADDIMNASRRLIMRGRQRSKSKKKSESTTTRQSTSANQSTTARRSSSFSPRKCLTWILGLGLWANNTHAYVNHPWSALSRNVMVKTSPSKSILLSSSVNNQSEEDSVIMDSKFLQRNKCWVVLVDDEEAIRQSVGDFLYDEGYEVTACDGADALLKLLAKSSTEKSNDPNSLPSVVVSDVRMPGMDGITLVQTLRQDTRYQKIPIVLLTAKAMTMDRITGFKAGADAYLPKPFHPDELLSILDTTIMRRKQIQEARRGTLAELKDEMDYIKTIMKRNSSHTVEKTNVYLTPAERDVLELVCQGCTNKEIASERGVTVDRVVKMVQKMLSTTNTKNRTELVRWAFKTGYVSPCRR